MFSIVGLEYVKIDIIKWFNSNVMWNVLYNKICVVEYFELFGGFN